MFMTKGYKAIMELSEGKILKFYGEKDSFHNDYDNFDFIFERWWENEAIEQNNKDMYDKYYKEREEKRKREERRVYLLLLR